MSQNKIQIRDFIGWGIAIIAIIVAIANGNKYHRNMQEINNKAKIVKQYIVTNNYNAPLYVVEAVDAINTASGAVVQSRIFKEIISGK